MMSAGAATVLASEVRMLESKHTGRSYRITISLPLGYAKSPGEVWPFDATPAQWPVVYVLDGNWYYGMVTDTIRPMAWCGSTTDAIVVGIGYAEAADPIEAFRDTFTRRNLDLTPVRDEAEENAMAARHRRPTPSGDAAGFHKFIQEELIPLVEHDYRANPARRILLGHSYGGLFAVYSLLEAPGLFDTLIIGSPTLAYGKRVLFQREETFAQTHTQLPAQVFLFMAELEEDLHDTTLTDTLRLAAILQSRNYAGFTLVKQIFLGQNHCEVAAPGFQAGLKFALKKYPTPG
jgi:predicted alpha/beta superfamily hydrolase